MSREGRHRGLVLFAGFSRDNKPYPGDAISGMVSEQICDAATAEFGGETWELLPFTACSLYPLEAVWAAGDW